MAAKLGTCGVLFTNNDEQDTIQFCDATWVGRFLVLLPDCGTSFSLVRDRVTLRRELPKRVLPLAILTKVGNARSPA
jgi:hypothetical protein